MHYCPHCRKPSAKSSGPCPHCGKELSGQSPEQSRTAAATEKHGEVSLDESGGSLELAVEPVRERMARAGGRGNAAKPAGAAEDEDFKKEKKKVRLQYEDEGELISISGYGAPPNGWFGSVSYMIKVLKRRKILDRDTKRMEDEVSGKKKNLDEDLLIIGRRKMTENGVEEEYPREMGAISLAREKVEDTRQERSEEARDMEDKEAFLDDEMMRLQNEVGKFRVEEEVLGKEGQVRNADYKKAKLKMQRFDIEIRNINQIMLNQSKGETAPSPAKMESFQSQLQDIEKRKQVLAPELSSLKEAAEETDRKLALVRSSMAELMGKMTLSSKRKSIVVFSLKKKSQELEEKYDETRSGYNDAVIKMSEAAIRQDDLPGEFKELKEKLTLKMQAVKDALAKLEKHRAARDAYSKTAFQRACITMGGGVLLVIVLIILLSIVL